MIVRTLGLVALYLAGVVLVAAVVLGAVGVVAGELAPLGGLGL